MEIEGGVFGTFCGQFVKMAAGLLLRDLISRQSSVVQLVIWLFCALMAISPLRQIGSSRRECMIITIKSDQCLAFITAAAS